MLKNNKKMLILTLEPLNRLQMKTPVNKRKNWTIER